MFDVLTQIILPFSLSALIVIIIMFIAERYGTKTGGIFGTLPSTIVIAYIFIAINQGLDFASVSAAVVPAELGINVVFLLVFAVIAHRSLFLSIPVSLLVWSFLSFFLYFFNLENIYVSILLYIISIIVSFIILEKFRRVESCSKVEVHYTVQKILLRGLLAGFIITISVLLSNFNPVLSGIFSVFPAILTSTMIISVREHGPIFASGLAKSMSIGISSVLTYATVIHFLYPTTGLIIGSIIAYFIASIVTIIIFKLKNLIK